MALKRRARSEAGRVLVEALRGTRFDGPRAPELTPQLLAAADSHGVVLALRRAYQAAGMPSDDLRAAARRLRANALRITHAAAEVSSWLGSATVPHAVIKGPAVAAAYPNADREFVDLDVLVAPADMERAIHELEHHGAVVLEPEGWPRSDGIAELVLGLPSGVAVDLHADLVHRQEVRRWFSFPPEPLLRRAVTAQVAGHTLPVLDPDDSCCYIALHAAVSGGDRLVWLADLDALVRQDEIRWDTLIARARQARMALVVGVMLERAVTVLDTPVPPEALDELLRGGRLWSRLLAAFERRRPTSESHGQIFRGQVLMRSTRSSTLTSLLQLASLIWTDVIVFVLTDSSHPWRTRLGRRRGDRIEPSP